MPRAPNHAINNCTIQNVFQTVDYYEVRAILIRLGFVEKHGEQQLASLLDESELSLSQDLGPGFRQW
jgi:hypothetical protein